jgi:C-terminal processing protease CtpA/Prc
MLAKAPMDLLSAFPSAWSIEGLRGDVPVLREWSTGSGSPTVQVTLGPDDSELEMTRTVRDERLLGRRATVRLRLASRSPSIAVKLRVSHPSTAGDVDYAAVAEVRSSTNEILSASVDLGAGDDQVEIMIIASGTGSVDFVDLAVDVSDYTLEVAELDARQLDHVVAFARALALTRYFHPSDQSADADWSALSAAGMRAALNSRTDAELVRALHEVLAPVGPQNAFYDGQMGAPAASVSAPDGAIQVTRWRHRGVPGGGGDRHWSDRPVASEPPAGPELVAVASRRLDLDGAAACPQSRLASTIEEADDTTEVMLWARILDDAGVPHLFEAARGKRSAGPPSPSLDIVMPPRAREMTFGVTIRGGAVRITTVDLLCSGRVVARLAEPGFAPSLEGHGAAWFSTSTRGGTGFEITPRAPANTLSEADFYTEELAPGVFMRLALGVWTDGHVTLPRRAFRPPFRSQTVNDVSARLAVVAQVWGVARYFYPDLSSSPDWDSALRRAMGEVAAKPAAHLHASIRSLVAELADAHAYVSHVAEDRTYTLPFKLVVRDEKLWISGVVKDETRVHVGDEVVSIDRVPARQAIRSMAALVSSSSPGWTDHAVATWLALGARGASRRLEIRSKDGALVPLVVPLIARRKSEQPAEPRPRTGASLAPGILYVNLESLTPEEWDGLKPALLAARGVIFDVRGYVTRTSYRVLASLTDEALASSYWSVQVRTAPTAAGVTFETDRWLILPSAERYRGRAAFLIDGRTGSAAETVMSIVHAYKLGTIVGERSAGTNGNFVTVDVGAGFSFRFTAVRVLDHQKKAFHRNGIVPDVLVEPSVAGLVSSRDEALEVATSLLQQP